MGMLGMEPAKGRGRPRAVSDYATFGTHSEEVPHHRTLTEAGYVPIGGGPGKAYEHQGTGHKISYHAGTYTDHKYGKELTHGQLVPHLNALHHTPADAGRPKMGTPVPYGKSSPSAKPVAMPQSPTKPAATRTTWDRVVAAGKRTLGTIGLEDGEAQASFAVGPLFAAEHAVFVKHGYEHSKSKSPYGGGVVHNYKHPDGHTGHLVYGRGNVHVFHQRKGGRQQSLYGHLALDRHLSKIHGKKES